MRGSVARGTLLGFAGQAWHLVTAFLLYAFLARQLGPAAFGNWRVVLSVLGWFEIVLHSGLIKVATQRIAESADEWRDYARASYVGQAIAAAGVLVLMLVLAGPIAASLSDPALATYVRISALDLPVYALLLAGTGVLLGQHRFERQIAASIVYATAKLVAVGLLVALGFSVTGALVGNAIASAVGFAVAFVPLPRGQRPQLQTGPLLRSMTVASVPFLTLSLVEGVGASADLWLVSALVVSPIAVGWYASATVLAEIPLFLFGGLNNVLFPSVASARAEGDHELASRYAVQAVRLALMTTALAIALAASTGRQALTLLYSAKFLGAYVPLAILMVASMGRVVRTSCIEVLMAQGRRTTSNAILVATVRARASAAVGASGSIRHRRRGCGRGRLGARRRRVGGAVAARDAGRASTCHARALLARRRRGGRGARVGEAGSRLVARRLPGRCGCLRGSSVAASTRSIETISLRCAARCADRLHMATEQHTYALSEMAASGQAVPDASDRKRTMWALASLTVIGAVLRLSTITSRGLWQDEAAQISQMTGTVLDTIKSQIGGTHPPLFHVLMHFWIQAFGTSEAALRSFSVLVGVASIPLAYWAGTTLYNRRVGLLAAGILAFSPYHIWYSQEARMYTLMTFFGLLSLTCFVKAMRENTRGRGWRTSWPRCPDCSRNTSSCCFLAGSGSTTSSWRCSSVRSASAEKGAEKPRGTPRTSSSATYPRWPHGS